jgi:hypothetical protein
MVYLIGGRHDIQFDPGPHRAKIVRDKRASFKKHVSEVIEPLSISILAEEFSDEAKRIWKVSESTLEQLAKAKGIEHRFCDPTSAQKRENGIEESDSDKREQFWLSCIQDCKSRNVLFVCGGDHVETFGEKLMVAGFDVKYGPRWEITDVEVWETWDL